MKKSGLIAVSLVFILPLLVIFGGCGNGGGGGEVTERTCTWDGSNWDECDWE